MVRALQAAVFRAAAAFPVVTLTGPRQSGKSTLCRACFPKHHYVNLEEPDTREFALTDPRGFLAQHDGTGVILDEVQRTPELVSYLLPRVDAEPVPGRWVLTGSQNFLLMNSVSQSLAGRVAVLHLPPLSWDEVGRFENHPATLDAALLTGGYPRILDQRLDPAAWIGSYIATYVERDVRTLLGVGDLITFQRFMQLCAGRTGQLLNVASLASDVGITQPTAKAWLSVLEASFIVHLLRPWATNLGKRLVKAPKLHFWDTGLAAWLMGIRTTEQLATHPLRGAIFESWVMAEILKQRLARGDGSGVFMYRDAAGREADGLIERHGEGGKRGVSGPGIALVEAKAGQTVGGDAFTSLSRVAAAATPLTSAVRYLVYGGSEEQRRSEGRVVPWRSVQGVEW